MCRFWDSSVNYMDGWLQKWDILSLEINYIFVILLLKPALSTLKHEKSEIYGLSNVCSHIHVHWHAGCR